MNAHADPPPEPRLLLALGLAFWLLSALSSLWEGLSLQVPDSPFHVGVLAGPIAQFRQACFGFGTGAVFLWSVWARLFPRGTGKITLGLLVSGALLQVLALAYAAAQGMLAVQLLDPRGDARAVVYVRLFAHALTLGALSMLAARAVASQGRGRTGPPSAGS